MCSMCRPVCLIEGPLLHVPWGSLSAAALKRALSSMPTTFPSCVEGLTVLLVLNEEEFALPWQKISHGPWQLWQLVMAACWWDLCNTPPPATATAAITSSLLLLLTTSWKALEMPESFFFSFDYKNNRIWKLNGNIKYHYILLQERERESWLLQGAAWTELSDRKELKSTQGNLEIYIRSHSLWKSKLHSWHPIFLADTPCKIDQYKLVTSSRQERTDGMTGNSMYNNQRTLHTLPIHRVVY